MWMRAAPWGFRAVLKTAWSQARPQRGQQEPVSCHFMASAATPRPSLLNLQAQPVPSSFGTGSPLGWPVDIFPPTVPSRASPVLQDTAAGLAPAADLLWHVTADSPGTARTQPSTYSSVVSQDFKYQHHPSRCHPLQEGASGFVFQVHGENRPGGRRAAQGAQHPCGRRAAPPSHLESPGDQFRSRAVPGVPSPPWA